MALDRFRGSHRPDWLLALATVALTAFGLTMILSASAYLAASSGNVYSFVTKQAISLAIGLVGMLILSQIDYHVWKEIAGPIIIVILLVLIGVFISPACRGVHRCIDLGPSAFQPAELVKLGFLLYLAAWFARLGPAIHDVKEGFGRFAILVAVVGGLIMLEPDMGTASTLILAAALMYFLAGAPLRHFALAGAVGVGLLFMLILVAPYRLARLQTYLQPSTDLSGSGYHTNQISIAIGSGGWWGLGFGQGKLKYLGYVPEVHTDSIFAVVVEELGFVRAALVLLVYLFIMARGFRIAKTAPDPFGRLLAAGITSLFAMQTFINLAAMLGVIPLTGIPLPLVSYGGSSLIVTLAGIGILLAISRQTMRPATA